jgi:ABC-type iron transport system FetAB ATPase subunit
MSVDQLKRISDKLQELVKRHEQLKRENERLRAELIPAKEREMAFMEQIGNLEQKILVLKAGTSNLSEAEKKEIDKKIHSYLKEIDRCISMLSE